MKNTQKMKISRSYHLLTKVESGNVVAWQRPLTSLSHYVAEAWENESAMSFGRSALSRKDREMGDGNFKTERKNRQTCALELPPLFLVFPPFDFQNGGGLIRIEHVTADSAKPLSSLWGFFNIVERNLSAFSHVLATLAKRSDFHRFSKAAMFVTSFGAYFEACCFEEGQVFCVS